MNIRKISLLTSLLLSLLFISLATYKLISLNAEKSANEDLQAAVIASSILNKAIIELSLERSVMQVTLNLPDAIAKEFRGLIDEQIKKSEAGFDEAARLVQEDDGFRRKDEFLNSLKKLREEINVLRVKADRNLSVPLNRRNNDDVKNLPINMKEIILLFSYLPIELKPENATISSKTIAMEGIQKEAWAIREFGGRERTYLAIAAATGGKLSDVTLEDMKLYHEAAEAAMHKLELIAGYKGLDAKVLQQVEKVRDVYFSDYKKIRKDMINASASGIPYSISFGDFFTKSSDALDTAVNLSYLAGDKMAEYIEEDLQHSVKMLWAFIIVLVVAICLCAFQIYYTMIRVSGRIDSLSSLMEKLTNGDTDLDLGAYAGSDEIDKMAEHVEVFRKNAIEVSRLEAEQKAAEERQAQEKKQATEAMANQFEEQVGGIVSEVEKAASDMQGMASILSDAIQKTSSQSATVASSSQEATTNVQTVAAAAEEMTASIGEISKNVRDTAQTAKECSQAAATSQSKLSYLQAAVEEIDSVIQSINDVAEQTNLLALNATIEAARAGEAGKGFAVVANEVKSLASETHKMTEEIARKVEDIKTSASDTISSVSDIITQISSVDDKTTNVEAAIDQQATATNEISQNVQQASIGTSNVSQSIEHVQQAANDSSASTEELKTASESLATQATELKNAVDMFLKEVRG
ncbi:MAG: methyl-accepting chemotaxis protein [Bdellovibrionales bacterium]